MDCLSVSLFLYKYYACNACESNNIQQNNCSDEHPGNCNDFLYVTGDFRGFLRELKPASVYCRKVEATPVYAAGSQFFM